MNKKRLVQFVTNIHQIHHITWGYGYTFRPFGIGYFRKHGFKKVSRKQFHDCTTTGIS